MLTLKNIVDKFEFASQPNTVGPIGLEFAIEKVQLVQLRETSEGEIVLRAHAALAYPNSREELLSSPHAIKKLLQQALKSAKFSGRKIVTILPANDIRMMSVAYQVAKGKSESEAILKLLSNRVEGELADYVIDYLPTRSATRNDEHLALVAIAKRKIVIEYLESMRASGLSVEALDIAPSAIKRLITIISNIERTENTLVINVGRIKSYMTLISGSRLLFEQEIDFGEAFLLKQISMDLDIGSDMARDLVYTHGLNCKNREHDSRFQCSAVEVSETLTEIVKPRFLKLVDEINRALIYAASETRGEPVKQVYLLGSIARWPGADNLLNQLVKVPVSLPDFLKTFGNTIESDNHQELVPEMAVATGLALRGMKNCA